MAYGNSGPVAAVREARVQNDAAHAFHSLKALPADEAITPPQNFKNVVNFAKHVFELLDGRVKLLLETIPKDEPDYSFVVKTSTMIEKLEKAILTGEVKVKSRTAEWLLGLGKFAEATEKLMEVDDILLRPEMMRNLEVLGIVYEDIWRLQKKYNAFPPELDYNGTDCTVIRQVAPRSAQANPAPNAKNGARQFASP